MTTEAEKQKKIDGIEINFNGDTELPRLNSETIEEFGFEDKPVLLKKNIIEKNLNNHPEVDPSDYKEIIGNSLYKPDIVLHGGGNKPYYNFISMTGEDKNAISLLQVENTNSGNFEIINMYWINNRGKSRKERRKDKA